MSYVQTIRLHGIPRLGIPNARIGGIGPRYENTSKLRIINKVETSNETGFFTRKLSHRTLSYIPDLLVDPRKGPFGGLRLVVKAQYPSLWLFHRILGLVTEKLWKLTRYEAGDCLVQVYHIFLEGGLLHFQGQ